MSCTVFHSGGMVTEPGRIESALAQLAPDERIVPLRILDEHWAGDPAALEEALRANSAA